MIVFPESVLPRRTPASDLFWADTIDALRSAGKVVVIGAITPTYTLRSATTSPLLWRHCTTRLPFVTILDTHPDNKHLSRIQTESLSEGCCPASSYSASPC